MPNLTLRSLLSDLTLFPTKYCRNINIEEIYIML